MVLGILAAIFIFCSYIATVMDIVEDALSGKLPGIWAVLAFLMVTGLYSVGALLVYQLLSA